MAPDKKKDRQRLLVFIGSFVFIGCAFLIMFPEIPHHHPPNYDRLMSAIEKKDAKTVEAILKGGFNPNTIPHELADGIAEDDYAPIDVAAEHGSTGIVRILLDHGADPNLGDGWHADPLSAATRNDSLDTMALLIERGAKLNVHDGTGSAIWRAAMDGKVKSVNFLLAHGATTTPGFLKILKETNGTPEVIQIIESSLRTPSKK